MNNVINNLANPVNSVAQAFDSRTQQLDAQQKQQQAEQDAAQKKRDNELLQVFEYAGDGRVDEARYLARSKGLDVPDQIFADADFSKGLTLAGKIYGNDPVAAQKFTQAWSANRNGDFMTRLTAAQQAAGVPIDPSDREYQQKIRFEMWKLKNVPSASSGGFSLSPGQARYDAAGNVVAEAPMQPKISRFEAGQLAYNKVRESGLSTEAEAEAARQSAIQFWDQEYGQSAGVSSGLMGMPSAPAVAQQSAAPQPQQAQASSNQRGTYAVQQALLEGYTPSDIVQNLMMRGMDQQTAIQMVNSASGVQ